MAELGAEEVGEARELVRTIGCVFQQIDFNSVEGRSGPVEKPFGEEYSSLLEEESFDESDVPEWDEVARAHPTARRVDTHLVVGEKGIELASGKRRYKVGLLRADTESVEVEGSVYLSSSVTWYLRISHCHANMRGTCDDL